MKNNIFRPVAIPLVTTDPYFSIWSFTDKLTDDHTRHWTGVLQSMFGFITIDGEKYRFMGKTAVTDRYFPEGKALEQIDVTVNPTSTVYTFSHPACELRVTFLTPLLLDRPEVFSRPVSYIFYEILPREEGHTFSVYFDLIFAVTDSALRKSIVSKKKVTFGWAITTKNRSTVRGTTCVSIGDICISFIPTQASVCSITAFRSLPCALGTQM